MRARLTSVLGLAVAAVLIWWVLRNEDPAEIWANVRGANFILLAVAVAVATGVFAVRAIRWRHLLAPVQPNSPFRSRFAAVCVGFMANNLLPVRAGEVARAYAYSRLEGVSTATALATLVVERLLDGVAILLLLVVAMAGPGFPAAELPEEIAAGVRWASGVLAAILGGILLLAAFPRRALRVATVAAETLLPPRLARAAATAAENVVAGLASLRGWRLMLPAFGWSLAVWLLQSLSFWIGFLAFGIELPFAAALVTNAAVALAVAIPAAPGFVGNFHAGAKVALVRIYGVGAPAAVGFAFGWHLGGFFPVTFMGLWYARQIGLTMRELRGGEGAEDGVSAGGTEHVGSPPGGDGAEESATGSRKQDAPAP